MLVRVNKYRGFTLIELAVVLFIVALLLGGLLSPLSTRLEQQSRARTTDLLNDIEESLIGYAVINGRLPCPDCPNTSVTGCGSATANDGQEDLTGTSPNQRCASAIGNLPWVDLQVSENDDWGRHFTYRVSLEFARESQDNNPPSCGTPAVGVSFELCSDGDINIFDGYIIGTTGYTDATLLAANPQVFRVAENVPAIVISHGSDGYEPSQTDQQVENWYDTAGDPDTGPTNPDIGTVILSSYTSANFTPTAFIHTGFSRDNSLSPSTQFDDLVIWISPAILMNRMVISGKLP